MEKEFLKPAHAVEHPTEEEIDETLEETFPASDPPWWTLGVERHGKLRDVEDESKCDHVDIG